MENCKKTNNKNQNNIRKDLSLLIGCSGFVVVGLICVMFFSPLSSQYNVSDVNRGETFRDISELQERACYSQALSLVDSLIAVKYKGLPRYSYFDRFLEEEERFNAQYSRSDIYELKWLRIEILQKMGEAELLKSALEDYSNIIGYNQDKAKGLLNHLNNK